MSNAQSGIQLMNQNPAADALGITDLRAEVAALTQLVRDMAKDSRPPFYTVQQFADAKGVSAKTITRRIATGKIERTSKGISRDQL